MKKVETSKTVDSEIINTGEDSSEDLLTRRLPSNLLSDLSTRVLALIEIMPVLQAGGYLSALALALLEQEELGCGDPTTTRVYRVAGSADAISPRAPPAWFVETVRWDAEAKANENATNRASSDHFVCVGECENEGEDCGTASVAILEGPTIIPGSTQDRVSGPTNGSYSIKAWSKAKIKVKVKCPCL